MMKVRGLRSRGWTQGDDMREKYSQDGPNTREYSPDANNICLVPTHTGAKKNLQLR